MIWFLVLLLWLAVAAGLRQVDQRKSVPSSLYLDVLASGLLFWLTLGFFWRTISGDVYQPADGGDLVSFLFPTYRFAASQLHQWTLPLWNPHLYGGAPFISDIQAGFLYPPNLLLFLLKPDFTYRTMQWLAIGHLYWAGLGVYVLLRTLRGGDDQPVARPAALFAALAFQFSDPLLIHLGNLNLIAVLSWLPWVLAAYHRALEARSLRWTALAALLFAIGNYAGHAQSTLYIGLTIGVYTVIKVGVEIGEQRTENREQRTENREQKSEIRRIILRSLVSGLWSLMLLVILTFLLNAPILLPAMELTRYTERSHFTYQDTVGYSLAPTQALGLLTPSFFGHGPALHWGLWQRVETPYAGVATLILAAAGLLLAGVDTRRKLWPWLGLALFGFVTALGIYAILHGWLTLLLPGFGQLRAPARTLILWTLGISVLAAFGLDSFLRKWSAQSDVTYHSSLFTFHTFLKTTALILLGSATPLVYLALLLTQKDETEFLRASVAALAITLATGFWVATWLLIKARLAQWLTGALFATLMIALLFLDLSAVSAYTDISPTDPTVGYQHPEIIAFLKNDPDLFRIDTRTDIAGVWQPDTAALVGLQDVGGIANPLTLSAWQQLWDATGGRQSQAYDMLNVKYVILRKGTPLPEGKFELALDAPGELAVYRNKHFLPRAWLASGQGDLNALTPDTQAHPVAVTHYGSSNLTLQTQASAATYLVLSEIWYPGWRATVNGAPAEVVRVNGGLRAVAVPAGGTTVELWFAPRSWLYGLGASAAGLILLLIMLLIKIQDVGMHNEVIKL
ncbi:MAG: hypothetical protein U0350_26805 [Caldilineaceae bacterium]